MNAIDLNCDLGERTDADGIAADTALLDFITSANIACGAHAGDESTMSRIVSAAIPRGVALGAHPGYPDPKNFGRIPFDMDPRALEDSIAAQIDALLKIIARAGGELTHVKLHGALYHAAMRRRDIAEIAAKAIVRVGVPVIMIAQSAAPALDVWRTMGHRVAAEAFADRHYEPDGSLTPRNQPNALIDDPAQAAAQALSIARGHFAGGTQIDTICLHSDTPHAIDIARAIRDALTRDGIRLKPLRK